MFCQLETLRHCLPPSVRCTLDELPESLDETYERVLKEIKKPNRDHACRLLQCLVVAIRPLDVKELAEVLAVDFDDAEGVPRLKPNWRWEDEEQALLTSCSSLITTVKTDDSRVVQFSHFSVKEYLTSDRIATSSGDVSRYHIDLEPAHTILAQACMSVLLQPDNRVEGNGVGKSSPLAEYAARHWVAHAQFERVSSFLRKAMEHLFDLDKPYFDAWVQLHDIDTHPNPGSSSLYWLAVETKSVVTPLYHAALCGFEDLVGHLVDKYPQHVNTSGGYYVTPLVVALAGRQFHTADVLRHKGAQVDVCGRDGETPLHSAVSYGDFEMVRVLLDYEADVNALGLNDLTPIHYVSQGFPFSVTLHNIHQSLPDVTRLLLDHGANVHARNNDGSTPLHVAADRGTIEVVPVLLEYGADAGAADNEGRTPLHEAAHHGRVEVVRVLLEHSANASIEDNKSRTPLHEAADYGNVEVVRVLLEHGANASADDNQGRTPLHEAAHHGRVVVVRVLLEHGASASAEDNQGRTPLHEAADHGSVEVVRVLLERGANASAGDNQGRTPLHEVADHRRVGLARLLLEHDANASAEDDKGRTPFQIASVNGDDEIMKLLSEHGANCQGRVVA